MSEVPFENVPIIPVNSKERSREMGFVVFDGKISVTNFYFVGNNFGSTPTSTRRYMVSKFLHVGGAGDIVFERKDGGIGIVLNAQIGWHPIMARRILTFGEPDGGGALVFTTATNITYHGGD